MKAAIGNNYTIVITDFKNHNVALAIPHLLLQDELNQVFYLIQETKHRTPIIKIPHFNSEPKASLAEKTRGSIGLTPEQQVVS